MKCLKNMDCVSTIAIVLLVIGGLNWGLVGLLNIDLVAMLLGTMTLLAKVVYTLVGLSAVYVGFTLLTKH